MLKKLPLKNNVFCTKTDSNTAYISKIGLTGKNINLTPLKNFYYF